jgi:hypothetical protein
MKTWFMAMPNDGNDIRDRGIAGEPACPPGSFRHNAINRGHDSGRCAYGFEIFLPWKVMPFL